MILQPFEQVLIDGGRRDLLKFGSCEHCVVVDWRDDMETVLGAVRAKLPGGYLEYRPVDDETWEVCCHGVAHRLVTPKAGANSEPLLRSINRTLLPEHEMRIFTPTMGDAYSLLVRPANWWSEFSATYPARARKLFVTTDARAERVAIPPPTESKPKSWLRRLVGI